MTWRRRQAPARRLGAPTSTVAIVRISDGVPPVGVWLPGLPESSVVTRPGAVRWIVARRILWAWIFTIPAAALISTLIYLLARALGL
jgi:phosphate/sulfate permease